MNTLLYNNVLWNLDHISRIYITTLPVKTYHVVMNNEVQYRVGQDEYVELVEKMTEKKDKNG